MSTRIRISWPRGEATATLRDTPTAHALLGALPLQSRANTWGDEVYFRVPFSAQAEPDATDVVDRGAVCFWLDGDALALLFGPTPVSRGDECRLISAANVVGRIDGDPGVLGSVQSGATIGVERA
ncbi:MAG: hypothetical protein H6959_09805 [Chromatiaceae bacterium]|nr:hypothetical protein [Chromatiaceae bacterium]MCP5423200.1 hypothetical protein [Chromatiaceae bacterium]